MRGGVVISVKRPWSIQFLDRGAWRHLRLSRYANVEKAVEVARQRAARDNYEYSVRVFDNSTGTCDWQLQGTDKE